MTARRDRIRNMFTDTFHHDGHCNDGQPWHKPLRWPVGSMVTLIDHLISEETRELTERVVAAELQLPIDASVVDIPPAPGGFSHIVPFSRLREERDKARASLFNALIAIGKVAELHRPDPATGGRACLCGATKPCKTARALSGWAEA